MSIPGKQQSPNEDVDQPANDLLAQHAHSCAAPARGNGQQNSDKPEQRPTTDAKMPKIAAYEIAANPGEDVDEEIPCRAVKAFDLRAKIHASTHMLKPMCSKLPCRKTAITSRQGSCSIVSERNRSAQPLQNFPIDRAKIVENAQVPAGPLQAA